MLIGRLGRDPEIKYSQSGIAICNLRVATDESYVDKDGNRVEKAEWHSVVCYQRQAENCQTYLQKGSLIYAEGSLQTRKWKDQQEQDRYTTEIKVSRIQFLDRKDSNQQQGQRQQQSQSRGNQHRPQDEDLGPAFPSVPSYSGMDDVPF